MILGVELPLEQVYSQDLSDIWLTAGLFMLVTRARMDICGFTGPKTPKIRSKKPKNQPKNPNFAIKWERKVLETQFWYQTKALNEQNLNKLLWRQLNEYKVSKSQQNMILGSKIAISRPPINLNMTTFNIRPTPKIFFGTLHNPY